MTRSRSLPGRGLASSSDAGNRMRPGNRLRPVLGPEECAAALGSILPLAG